MRDPVQYQALQHGLEAAGVTDLDSSMSAQLYPCRKGASSLAPTAFVILGTILLGVFAFRPATTRADSHDDDRDWRHYGNDLGNMLYRNVNQINRDNVARPRDTASLFY